MTYVNPTGVITCGVLFPILGTIAVVLRFMVKRRRKSDLGVDDWLCIPALMFIIAESGMMIGGAARHAYGYHSPASDTPEEFFTADPPNQRILAKLETAFNLMAPTTIGLLKLSVVFFYRRIFRGKIFNILSWATIGFTIVWVFVFTIAYGTACRNHFAANWESIATLKEECADNFRLLVVYSITDVAVDLLVMFMPMPMIFGLQMPLRRRLAVAGIFLIGALAIACGITRMVIFIEVLSPSLLKDARVAGLLATDDIGVVSLLVFWGYIEVGVGMIAICLPTLRPLFAGMSPESIMRSFRNVMSLPSTGSKGSKGSSNGVSSLGRGKGDHHHKLGSESSLTAINMATIGQGDQKISNEGTTTKAYGLNDDWKRMPNDKGIMVDRAFQVRDSAV